MDGSLSIDDWNAGRLTPALIASDDDCCDVDSLSSFALRQAAKLRDCNRRAAEQMNAEEPLSMHDVNGCTYRGEEDWTPPLLPVTRGLVVFRKPREKVYCKNNKPYAKPTRGSFY